MKTRPRFWLLLCSVLLLNVTDVSGQTRVYRPMLQSPGCAAGQCSAWGSGFAANCPGGVCPTGSHCADGRCNPTPLGNPGQPTFPIAGVSSAAGWEPVAAPRDWQMSTGPGNPYHPVSSGGTAAFPDLPSSPGQLRSQSSLLPVVRNPADSAFPLITPADQRNSFPGRSRMYDGGNVVAPEYRNRPVYQGGADFPASQEQPFPGGHSGFGTRVPLSESRSGSGDTLEPFVPSQIPLEQMEGENTAIFNEITARYQNPVNVRTVRGLTADQALHLYEEVSTRIDERHLEPSSYDLRVRRGLRNLSLALDNPMFLQSLGVSADSFRLDAFRNTLNRLSTSMQVSNTGDANRVLRTVMQEAQSVPGLTPSVVAYEFTNGSIDTLDRFSALEPNDPIAGSGAFLDNGYRTASLEENMVGLGVEVKQDAAGLMISRVLREGPAEGAGVVAGDVVIAIDGHSIAGLPISGSVDLLKGSEGASTVLRIRREGRGEKNFSIVRRRFRVWTVNDARILPDTNVAYLSLNRFAANSTSELDQTLTQLHRQGMKSVIIDLRGNPGGLLTTCVEISDRFLPCGTIVSTRGRLSEDNMVETATRTRTWSTPLVVLVDGDSASASEIFAAAVQENARGVVVGMRSYGKGTVQTHFPLNTLSGNLRLTTARFYSPNGRPMAGSGVTPDVVVEDTDGAANGDRVLQQAIEIAQSRQLAAMAEAAGNTCRTGTPAAARSSSIDRIRDFSEPTAVVR